jgi:hypothetical protein
MALPNFGFLARMRADEMEANAAREPEEAEERAQTLDADAVAERAERRAAARAEQAKADPKADPAADGG